MEHQARYNLDAALENWRAELAAQPNLTAEVRRELETHLRDTLAGFRQRGLSDEEAFWLARRRVGQPPESGEEFVKSYSSAVWRERAFWILFTWVATLTWMDLNRALTGNLVSRFFSHASSADFAMVRSAAELLILIIPVSAVVFRLARWRSGRAGSLLPFFFQTRVRFAGFAVLTIMLATVFSELLYLELLKTQQIQLLPVDIADEWHNLGWKLASQLMFLPLLVWLLPAAAKRRSVPAAARLPGFELNAGLDNWRQELTAQPALTAEARRELETHLRDTLAGFRQHGLTDEEAFSLARRRVGRPERLGEEFRKVNPSAVWRERVFWAASGWVAIVAWRQFSSCVGFNLFMLFAKKIPESEMGMALNALDFLCGCVPVCAALFWLARQRGERAEGLLSIAFYSRRRFALSAVLFVALAVVLTESMGMFFSKLSRLIRLAGSVALG